jgi:hypothetical protein
MNASTQKTCSAKPKLKYSNNKRGPSLMSEVPFCVPIAILTEVVLQCVHHDFYVSKFLGFEERGLG